MSVRHKRARRETVDAVALRVTMARIKDEYFGGRQNALAQALHLSQPHISRILAGTEHLGVESCLRLAVVTGLAPEPLWTLHGHDRFVDDHRQVYGVAERASVVSSLSPAQRAFKEDVWDRLTERERTMLRDSVKALKGGR